MQARSDGDHLPASAKVEGAVRIVSDVLSRFEAEEWRIVADATRLSGRYLLVEVLNIRSIGPNLVLSGDANPSDGFLHVVLAGEEDRDAVASYLHDRLQGRGDLLSLTSQCAQRVTLQVATDIHVDDTVLPGSAGQIVSIHIETGAVELLRPAE
jgi:diacylglycerol kinase family enzyme